MAQYDCEIFAAHDLRVTWGINEGDGLGPPELCCAGDIYTLAEDARPCPVTLTLADDDAITVTRCDGPAAPAPGAAVQVLASLQLMATGQDVIDALALRAGDGDFVLPLSPLRPATGYALIAIDPGQTRLRLSQLVHSCFGAGTRIMAGDGTLVAIEDVAPGDAVLTRDHGAQPVAWAGRISLRAQGPFAPVIIPPGLLGNLGALTVGPLQRIFLYQRGGVGGDSRSELLVQAQHIVDGGRVQLREGGVVTYHALAFDAHQIIYAEGVPVESLLVSRATVARLPDAFARELAERFPGLDQRAHFARELPAHAVPAHLRAGGPA